MHPDGVQEVVADKGYHSNEAVLGLEQLEVRTYIAEPDRGLGTGSAGRRRLRSWQPAADSRPTRQESAAATGRKRIENFAHQFDTGGLDRLYVRGKSKTFASS